MGCGASKTTAQPVPVRERKQQEQAPPRTVAPTKDTGKDKAKDTGKDKTRDQNKDKRPAVDKAKDKTKDESNGDPNNNKKVSREDQLRQELLAATESRQMGRLEKAITDYEHHQLPNNADLVRARRVLASLHEQELQAAMEQQDLEALEAAIDAANNSVVSPELHEGQTLEEAEALRSLLRRLRLYLHQVLDLKPMTVSEIHSYKRPRPLVHAVMKATYLLLGEQERLLKEWHYIQSLLRRQGQASIIRRIKAFDLQRMKMAKVHRAEGHLRPFNKDTVRLTSAGAGTFYMWSYNIINEGKSGGKGKT